MIILNLCVQFTTGAPRVIDLSLFGVCLYMGSIYMYMLLANLKGGLLYESM